MTDITLSDEQNNAIESILEWYRKGGTVFTLTGYAGTGKTTVLSTLLEKLSDKVAVALCAPTGKATSVLRSKMGPYCRAKSIATLHRTIYYPPEEIEKNNLLFTSRKHIPADMLIIDEASMLNKEILWDVLKLNVPTVLIGDNFQLPPVSGEHIDELDNPDARLTHVFRQALDNPIIKAATMVREEGRLPDVGLHKTSSGACGVFPAYAGAKYAQAFFKNIGKSNTTLLCYTNSRRQRLNIQMRDKLGYTGNVQVGEKIVVLRNTLGGSLYNGEVHKVLKIGELKDLDSDVFVNANTMVVWLEGCHEWVPINGEGLDSTSFPKVTPDMVPVQYGYALSVHKAQGSEWDNVVLYADYKPGKVSDEEYTHWLYTGVTRAKRNLLVIR